MRVEPHEIGSVMHIMKRGARGMPIVHDNADRVNFLRSIFYLNDEYQDSNWRGALKNVGIPFRPPHWPERKPLVALWAFTLMPNHFHLIVQEILDGGIAKFMQRLCGSMSAYSNAKYEQQGSLFQGAYKARAVHDDADLRWLASYVMVKNTLELYPGGIKKAANEFSKAWEWGLAYPFSSMRIYAGEITSPLIEVSENILYTLFKDPRHFKRDSRDMFEAYRERNLTEDQNILILE